MFDEFDSGGVLCTLKSTFRFLKDNFEKLLK